MSSISQYLSISAAVSSQFRSSYELEKLDQKGASALDFSELKYIRNTFCALGINHLEPGEAKNLAHNMRKFDAAV